MISLPLAAFKLVSSPQNSFIARGFGAGATLLALVLVLFIVARIIGGRGPGNLTKRQQRKVAARPPSRIWPGSTPRATGLEPEDDSVEARRRRLLSLPVVPTMQPRAAPAEGQASWLTALIAVMSRRCRAVHLRFAGPAEAQAARSVRRARAGGDRSPIRQPRLDPGGHR